jgi:hypothetical protein
MLKNTKLSASKEVQSVIELSSFYFCITGLLVLAFGLFSNSNDVEILERVLYLVVIMLVIRLALSRKKLMIKSELIKLVVPLVMIILTILGIGSIENHGTGVNELKKLLWLGFGPEILLLSLVIALFFPIIFFSDKKLLALTVVKLALSLIAIFTSLISFYQDRKSLIDTYTSEYIINELLAPLAGRVPFHDFIPQYQGFIGFLFVPFRDLLSSDSIVNLILISLYAISIGTMTLGIYLSWLGLNKSQLSLAIIMVLTFSAITPFPERIGYLGSIATLLSAFPIRLFFSTTFLALFLFLITKRQKSTFQFFGVGTLGGVLPWLSQDFGLAALATSLFVLLILHRFSLISLKLIKVYAASSFVGALLYPLTAFLFGHTIRIEYYSIIPRAFSAGFGAEGIKLPGPVLVLLPLVVFLIVFNLRALRYTLSRISSEDLSIRGNLIGIIFSFFSLLGFSYYINRSYASGQMQILLFPLSIALASTIGILVKDQYIVGSVEFRDKFRLRNQITLQKYAVLLVMSLPIASVLALPNPRIELDRIKSTLDSPRWPKDSMIKIEVDAKNAINLAKTLQKNISYFGESGSWLKMRVGIEPVLLVNSPTDLGMGGAVLRSACEHLNTKNPELLFVSKLTLDQLWQFPERRLCGTYVESENHGILLRVSGLG